MALDNVIDDCVELRGLGLVDEVVHVLSYHRLVRRDLHDVKRIYLLELLALGHCGTGHTGELVIESEVVLECNGRESLALVLNVDTLFCFDRLMQTLVVASAEHDASGELVDYEHLAVLHDIVNIAAHDAYRLYCLVDVVLYGHVRGIHEVVEIEILLCLCDTLLSQHGGSRLFVNYDVAVFADLVGGVFESRRGAKLFYALEIERAGKSVRLLIEIGRAVAAAGYDKRRSRLIDKYRVDLVDYRERVTALNLELFVGHHVVTQIVEAHLVVRAVGYVGGICLTALVVVLLMDYQTDLEPEEAVDLAHPLAVAACEVVVDRDDVDSVAGERVEISGERCDERFALAGLHLRDASLMQNDTAENLHGEVLHPEHTPRSLAAGGERLGQDIVKGLAVGEALLEIRGFCLELLVGEF